MDTKFFTLFPDRAVGFNKPLDTQTLDELEYTLSGVDAARNTVRAELITRRERLQNQINEYRESIRKIEQLMVKY